MPVWTFCRCLRHRGGPTQRGPWHAFQSDETPSFGSASASRFFWMRAWRPIRRSLRRSARSSPMERTHFTSCVREEGPHSLCPRRLAGAESFATFEGVLDRKVISRQVAWATKRRAYSTRCHRRPRPRNRHGAGTGDRMARACDAGRRRAVSMDGWPDDATMPSFPRACAVAAAASLVRPRYRTGSNGPPDYRAAPGDDVGLAAPRLPLRRGRTPGRSVASTCMLPSLR
jgi:hypothetical protein